MQDGSPQHCWEFHNCSEQARNKCPAYMYPEEKCWLVASSFKGAGCPKAKEAGFAFCIKECGWYKQQNPGK